MLLEDWSYVVLFSLLLLDVSVYVGFLVDNWIVTDFTLKTDVQFSFGPIWIALVSGRKQYSDMYRILLLWLSFRDISYIWSSVPVARGDGGVQVPWVMALSLLRLLFGTGVLVSANISTWMLIKNKKTGSCFQGSSKLLPFPFILHHCFLWW